MATSGDFELAISEYLELAVDTDWVGDKVEGAGSAWGEDKDGVEPTFGLTKNCVGFGVIQVVPDPSKAR